MNKKQYLVALVLVVISSFAGGIVSNSLLFRDARAGDEYSAKVVKAQRFELVNSYGVPQAVLGFSSTGEPDLTFFDENGKDRAMLFLHPTGEPDLTFFDENGTVRAGLVLHPTGASGLIFADENGKARAGLTLDSTGTPRLDFDDENGHGIWQAP